MATKAGSRHMTVNGQVIRREVAVDRTLAEFLREELGLTGTHLACNNGICGSCTVIVDDAPVRACLMLAATAVGSTVQTIEGLASRAPDGRTTLHPLQRAFIDHGAVQCGFCIPGMIMTAKALLNGVPEADREQIARALEGNLCRCTGYVKIIDAIEAAAEANRS